MKKPGALREQRSNGHLAVLDPQQKISNAMSLARANGAVYLSAKPVDLYSFDESYIELLRRGDWATQNHFVAYFGRLLRVKLRSRKLPAHVIQDVQQETFLRALVAVRTEEVHQPERLGAFVNAVCNNILFEHYRQLSREQLVDLDAADGPDSAADLEAMIIADERVQSVRRIIRDLPDKEQEALQAVLENRDKDVVCRKLGVDRNYLRVLTHRAIKSFRERHRAKKGPYGSRQIPKR